MTVGHTEQGGVRHAIAEAGFFVTEEVRLDGRPARIRPLPDDLHPALSDRLSTRFPGGLYSHQAEGMTALRDGQDICLATPTASGKSLVFLAHAADLLLREPDARVLAFYPAKALIRDQLGKWKELLEPLGLTIGFIDGSVAPRNRAAIVRESRVVLMTPDVAHAWLMSNLSAAPVRDLLMSLRMLVLDEAHVYEGVFGTNMAYLTRRLRAVAAPHRLVCSTATIDDPAGFVRKLTGRAVQVFTEEESGASVVEKAVLAIRPLEHDRFDGVVELVSRLASSYRGRFIVFADSRRMVELVVAALDRVKSASPDEEPAPRELAGILPYRAGYEEDDRVRIQQALQEGTLSGVVSTSALELGLDIGEIDLVVLLGVPPTMKAFWQRLGRAGRRDAGTCLILDDAGDVSAVGETLSGYLDRPLEPSWLYLDNRYIQYAHALSMAIETKAWAGPRDDAVLDTTPASFRAMLANELDPEQMVPSDLYPLKQLAQADPHHQFPLRCGIEPSLQVHGPFTRLGTLTWSQVLREAYPGAVYYYMATPYRITSVQRRRQQIRAKREGHCVTQPNAYVMVFPGFEEPMNLWLSEAGFVAEVPMQVNERVVGFREQRGKKKTVHEYGPTSSYSRRELTRFFETTGVCWHFADPALISEPVAQALLDAFSLSFGIQRSDLGVGPFFARHAPTGEERCKGICIYDSTHGSLRLTQRFGEHFGEILRTAEAQAGEDDELLAALRELSAAVQGLRPGGIPQGLPPSESTDDIVEVVAPGERAMHVTAKATREVRVLGWRYTPHGLMYELEVEKKHDAKEMVPVHAVQALRGETRLVRVNLVTGEEVGS